MERPLPVRTQFVAREQKALAAALETDADTGEFEGYASLFGVEDQVHDVVRPGAFRRTLRQRGIGNVKLLYQHDAREPIGVWREIREDDKGLFVRGRLLPEVQRAREVLALMRAGALDGLSIGYQVVGARKDRRAGTRDLIDIDLWEISLVTFPLLPEARVTRVKRARSVTFAEVTARARKLSRGSNRTVARVEAAKAARALFKA